MLAAGTRGRTGARFAAPSIFVLGGAEAGEPAAGFAAATPRADRLNVNRAFGGTLESSAFGLELLNPVDERLMSRAEKVLPASPPASENVAAPASSFSSWKLIRFVLKRGRKTAVLRLVPA